jgi:MiaB/RimO family radical SAM methylthiotransferase
MDLNHGLCYAPPMPQSSPCRFWLVTLGCKVNQYETRTLAEAFAAKGWLPAEQPETADRIVVVSCAVTARAEAEGRRLTRNLLRLAKPGASVVVTGCAAVVSPDAFAALGALPVRDKAKLAAAPETLTPWPPRPGDCFPALSLTGYDRSRALVKIQDGCSHGCSYCIVPAARGPSVSRPYADILAEARRLVEAGHAELGLTGINLGHFGPDLHPAMTFWQLVAALEADLLASHGPAFRLRLGSLDPAMLGEEGLAVLGRSRRVCRHLHVSLQSADPAVLTAMNRRPGDAEAVSSFVDKLSRKWPSMALGLDLLAGFPGESDAAQAETAAYLGRLPVTYAHVFPYSRRPGTPAAAMAGQLPNAVKAARAAQLRHVAADKAGAFLLVLAAEAELTVAVEGISPAAGSCGRYVDCRFVDGACPRPGSLLAAKPVGIDGEVLLVAARPGAPR